MDDAQRHERMIGMLEEELASGTDAYWWLSFCDPDKPTGQQFIGIIIVKAKGFTLAVRRTHSLMINPGGEVQGCEIPIDTPWLPIKDEHLDRLMSKADLKAAGLDD